MSYAHFSSESKSNYTNCVKLIKQNGNPIVELNCKQAFYSEVCKQISERFSAISAFKKGHLLRTAGAFPGCAPN